MLVNVGSTLVISDRGFLLIKSKTGAGKGLWNNPGGRLEKGESIKECAQRETEEESGYKVKLGKLILTSEFKKSRDTKVIKKVYSAEVVSGDPENRWTDEIEEVRWFTEKEIEGMSEMDFTFGAIQSIRDFSKGVKGKKYYPKRIA